MTTSTDHQFLSGRRAVLGGLAASAVAAALAGCGKSDSNTATSKASASASPSASADLAVAKLAAGLEVLAVSTYTSALTAATGGKLGTVPAAVATYVTTAKGHHEKHLAAWNSILTSAGESAVSTPNATLKPTVDAELAKVTDVASVAKLALSLEEIAAQTYLSAIPSLTSKAAIQKAGEIMIVDQQHQAILLYCLGEYPVPNGFLGTEKAAKS